MIRKFLMFLILPAALAVGCGDNGDDHDVTGGDTLVQDTVADTTQGDAGVDTGVHDATGEDVIGHDVVDDASAPEFIGQNPIASECGGFAAQALATVPRAAGDTICGDETLHWEVDTVEGLVHFTNANVFLNCCGLHGINVYQQDGVFVITETDDPEGEGLRCNCMCLFDFAVDMPVPAASEITVRIERLVTDEMASPVTVWEGTVDLTSGSGDLVIEEDVGWCYEPINIGLNPQFSGCGGFQGAPALIAETCADEMLTWTYDAESRTVSFVDSGAWLNCCGVHDISIFDDGSTYIIEETDQPDGEGGRCKCMCDFDFSIDLPDMSARRVDVQVIREITDDGLEPIIVWEGEINLSEGSGQIVLIEDVGYCD